jgi:predicted transcriptional regulator of viral defense system
VTTNKERKESLIQQFTNRIENSQKHVFSPAEIVSLLTQLRAEYPFPRSLSERKLQRTLVDDGILREISLTATYSFEGKRYHFGAFSEYELALSLKPGAYLSHGTAAQLHGLIDNDSTTIYINKEQSPKSSKGTLTQVGIDQAFAAKQRTSAYTITHQQTKIVLLSGKHSGRLGVTKIPGSQGEQLELTDLERTLIDLAVRPTYAGGAQVVANAYRNAQPMASISRLAKILHDLNYVYPYHQVVGFYLQNAGCPLSALQPLRDPGLHFDFYLEHAMKRTRFDSTWRLHVPEDLSGVH